MFYFIKNIAVVLSLVLIWRGVWYGLDFLDKSFFNGNQAFSVVGGFIAGILLLYLPDKDLKEIEKL